jgi:RNA polymerase sigma-70 factor (ECF subfamily)
MLQTVLGLDAAAIARAFLVSPKTMGQRLVRAKNKIRRAGIAFEIPGRDQLSQRLQAVLNAIYAAYGAGWEDVAATPGTGLADEALWLARVLREQMPQEPEVRGLLALILHCEARRPARRSAAGHFIALADQDPNAWLGAWIDAAECELAAAVHLGRIGRFQLEAAIQSVHAERRSTRHTDWHAICAFYDRLLELAPSLGARVARAAAYGQITPAAALITLGGLEGLDATAVRSYQPYWAVRADLLQRLGRGAEAAAAFERAIGLSTDPSIREFLLRRANPPRP